MKYADKLNWYFVSKNKNITLDIIESNPDLPWNYEGLSHNPNLMLRLKNILILNGFGITFLHILI